MKKKYSDIVKKVINEADIVLEILDARMVVESRNAQVESLVRRSGKRLVFVVNKIDLVRRVENAKMHPVIFVSTKQKRGIQMLRQRIMIEANKRKKENVIVGVIGYPNVGKSSVINALRGKKSAPTSSIAGFTKGMQLIRISQRVMLMDTPGVLPKGERKIIELIQLGSKMFDRVTDPDIVVMEIMTKNKGMIERFYKVDVNDDKEKTLEDIARKKHVLKKQGIPDVERAARLVLRDIQLHRIK